MNKIAIWGIKESGEKTYSYFCNSKGYELVAAADANTDLCGMSWNGVEVVTPDILVEMARNKMFDIIVFAFRNRWVKEVAARLCNYNNLKGYMIPTHISKFQSQFDDNSFVEIDFSKPRLKQFDVNIVDHCNMKCKGCLRYSNLVESPYFANFNEMIRDWKRIKELFWGVERLKIMGGEPMLSPDLCAYIQEARAIFPDADIMVTTNALLINDSQKELFRTMKENGVFFDISLYRPVEAHEDRLVDVLEQNGVWYELNHTKGNFYKIRSETPSYDPDKMYDACTAKDCHHLREGKISVCSAPLYAHYMNERYGTILPTEDGVYNIYKLDMDAWELDSKLSHSFESCKYCAPPVEYRWDRADSKTAKMSDWFVDSKSHG